MEVRLDEKKDGQERAESEPRVVGEEHGVEAKEVAGHPDEGEEPRESGQIGLRGNEAPHEEGEAPGAEDEPEAVESPVGPQAVRPQDRRGQRPRRAPGDDSHRGCPGCPATPGRCTATRPCRRSSWGARRRSGPRRPRRGRGARQTPSHAGGRLGALGSKSRSPARRGLRKAGVPPRAARSRREGGTGVGARPRSEGAARSTALRPGITRSSASRRRPRVGEPPGSRRPTGRAATRRGTSAAMKWRR